MELTREEAIRLHRKMWRWIRDEILKQKRPVIEREYFDTMHIKIRDRPDRNRYCCKYVQPEINKDGRCADSELCPIVWGNYDFTSCEDSDSPYGKWESLMFFYDRVVEYKKSLGEDFYEKCRLIVIQRLSELAGIIAELPEKE